MHGSAGKHVPLRNGPVEVSRFCWQLDKLGNKIAG
jgi:hypothetical protein